MTAPIPNNSPEPTDPELKVYRKPGRARWLKLRKTCVTSTEMASVAGIHKYGNTRFSLYHQKRGTLADSFVETQRTEVGLAIEHAIARLVSRRIGARMLKLRDFMVRGSMGSSFDYEVQDPKSPYDGWIVELKNVDGLIFKDQWKVDELDRVVPPDHIQIQVQHQLEVSRRPGAIVGVFIGGNDIKLGFYDREERMCLALRSLAEGFMLDVENENEPEVTGDDAAHAAALYNTVDPGMTIDATEDPELSHQLASYRLLGGKINELESQRGKIKAEVLQRIDAAAKVFGMDGYTLDAGITSGRKGTLITEEMVGTRIGTSNDFRRFNVRKQGGSK